ncbi:MAG: hypothetical protein IIA44_12750 [Acidobacteria bacterium]|nr:hypothetical protein [Acidobacteriota bacterium]
MSIRRVVAASVVVLSLTACAPQEDAAESDGTWVGTITTEGNVTTVVNESGSVWGGTATLVEEASIGAAEGPDHAMLSEFVVVHLSAEHILVADAKVPAVRQHDLEGGFMRDLGGSGQGPGEYSSPAMITTGADGRVFVFDARARRVNVYSDTGEPLDTYPVPQSACCRWTMATGPSGDLWLPVLRFGDDPLSPDFAVQAHGRDGPIDPFWLILDDAPKPVRVRVDGNSARPIPFAPQSAWGVAGPELVMVGFGDRYRIEIQHRGRVTRIIEKHWQPIPVDPAHVEWSTALLIASVQQGGSNQSDWTWDGAGVPSHQPAFAWLMGTQTGEMWVRRDGSSVRLDDCVADPITDGAMIARQRPCWRAEPIVDVFGADGRFLGEVELPEGAKLSSGTFSARGKAVVLVVEDEAGTIMVKRYRLVLPGEE